MKAAMTLAALCAAVLLVGTVQGDKIQVCGVRKSIIGPKGGNRGSRLRL